MAELERQHETKITYTIDTEDGAKEEVLDLAEMSDEELASYLFTLPQAFQELTYRQLKAYLETK